MTPVREAVVLPVIFLTVLLLGGLRLGGIAVLVAPTPYELILGILVIRVLVQSGAFTADRLMSSSRSTLANINGAVVVITLWLAASQTVALLIPDSGVPRLAFSVFFLILLLNTTAASPNRERALRSLGLTFGATFVLKFVVLQTMSNPADSPAKRALLALVDGVTAGVLIQQPLHAATAYLAFLAVALFLVGISLLPRGRELPGHQLAANPQSLPLPGGL